MSETEVIPDGAAILEGIQRNEAWSPVYRKALEELLSNRALRAGLREILLQSDEQLKNIGMADLTSDETIKSPCAYKAWLRDWCKRLNISAP